MTGLGPPDGLGDDHHDHCSHSWSDHASDRELCSWTVHGGGYDTRDDRLYDRWVDSRDDRKIGYSLIHPVARSWPNYQS